MPNSDLAIPICVDLDGTLTPLDTLHESLLVMARKDPAAFLLLPGWLRQGKAFTKCEIAARAAIDAEMLPYNRPLLDWLQSERARGRKLILATGSSRATADAIAAQLMIFDEVFATEDARLNNSGEAKRAALVARFGERGFDYAGNSRVDEAVWRSARQAIVVGEEGLAQRAAERSLEAGPVFAPPPVSWRTWLQAIRLYQWVKNLLIFLPALLSHEILQPLVLLDTVLAFLAFGLCASSVYVINDLFDLAADRRHRRKRLRPFASGALTTSDGVRAAIALLAAAVVVASLVNLKFLAVLATYYVFTWTYSLWLKRKPLVDVMTLAGLYTARLIAGAAATSIPLSFWLLAFSVFMFLSLGIVKRYTELEDARQSGRFDARGYTAADLQLLMSLGTSAGYSAIVVMALYISSPDSQALYRHSKGLWLICPLMLFWISRIWLKTTRGLMHDDPIIFTLRDRASLAIMIAIAVVVASAV